jgi:hypothetical protein
MKDGRPFDDERQLLGWLLARLAAPSRSHLDFTKASDEQLFSHGAVAPLFRAQMQYGRAVYRLSGLKLSEAAYPICRSMLELRAEITYVLGGSPSIDRALASMLWLILALQSPPGQAWPELRSAANDLRKHDPVLFAQISSRFKSKPFGHHSGMGWTKLVATYCGARGRSQYGFLSLHTHALAQGATNVEYSTHGMLTTRRYHQARPESKARSDVCLLAVDILTGTWDAIVAAYSGVVKPARRRS